ncbi:MAG: hypothetical protein JO210_13470, partial [Acidobacteriaceae bacterium]|nr:hypothetical protein [Acidobacteriaceae bacterium]
MRTRQALFAYTFAASFVTSFLLILYVWLMGPESSGINPAWVSKPLIQSVTPGSLSALADIRAGDLIVAADGQPLCDFIAWHRITANLEPDRHLHLSVERAGKRIERDLTFQRRPLRDWISSAGLLRLTFLAAQLVYIGLAVLILFARPTDVAASFGALLLGVCGTALTIPPEGFAAAWRHAPFLFQPLLWVNELSVCLGFGILITFLTLFPRPFPKTAMILFIAWLPDLIIQPWILRSVFDMIYLPNHAVNLPEWVGAAIPLYWVVYPLTAAALAVTNYLQLGDLNERRRVRLIFGGLCFAVAVNLPRLIFAHRTLSSTALGSFVTSPAASMIAGLASLSIPASFAVAVTRDRLFDIRIIIRQGVRYAIARGLLLSIAPFLGLVLAGDLAFHA